MEVVNHNTKGSHLTQIGKDNISNLFEEPLNERSKTSLRIHYEAQAEVIKRQIGGLEEIRLKIGVSQRKVCQLLLVDPSAWSRWTKSNSVPPHILRALQWYLIIQEKIPGLTPQYFVGKDPQVLHHEALRKISEEAQKRTEFIHNFLDQSIKIEEELENLKIRNHELEDRHSRLLMKVDRIKKILFLVGILLIGISILSILKRDL